MAILIGVDEAGYGPNYGPLCVAASAWRVGEGSGFGVQGSGGTKSRAVASPPTVAGPTAAAPLAAARAKPRGVPDLYKLLKKAVVRSPAACARRIAIADSKALYKPGLGLRHLERGVLAAIRVLQHDVATVLHVIGALAADPHARRHELACHAGDELGVPVESECCDLPAAAALLEGACAKNGVALVGLRARLVYPAEFNALCDEFGTKGAALSHVTLGLVREVVDACADGGAKPQAESDDLTYVFLDKHGGRNRYAALVQHHFPECWVDTLAEARAESRYAWEHGGRRIEAAFRVGCEEFLPTALASMTAKYQRELAMRAFNAFWTSRVPGLRPTAGYPGDAGRFREEIAAVQAELGIVERLLWRNR